MPERIIFFIAGLYFFTNSIDQFFDKIIPAWYVKTFIGAFLIYFSLFGVGKPDGHRLMKMFNNMKRKVGL